MTRRPLILAAAVLATVSTCAPVPVQAHHVREGLVRFKTTCNWSHTAGDDPIVHPGEPGASHSHEFFGNTTTSAATTTYEALTTGASTTCNDGGDLAGYWQPTLYRNGVRAGPGRMTAYYRLGAKHAPLQPFPPGLKMVSHEGEWECDGVPRSTPAGCGGVLKGRVNFADCWDGVNLDSADHISHMADSLVAEPANVCPPDHPVPVPRLSTYTTFGSVHAGDVVTLSSGDATTWHGDFMNGWDPARMAERVADCLNAYQHCDSGA